jgi:hypothetical protein
MSRSHQRDDQEARERQMQQDIESAMSMCERLFILTYFRPRREDISPFIGLAPRVKSERLELISPSPSTIWIYTW